MGFFHGEKPLLSEEGIHLPPLTPLTRAANIRSFHADGSTQLHSRGSRVGYACLAPGGTDALSMSLSVLVVFTVQPSYPPLLPQALPRAPGCCSSATLGGRLSSLLSAWFPGGATPLPPSLRALSTRRSYEGSDSCSRSPARAGLPACCAWPSDHSVSKHAVSHDHRLLSPSQRGHRFSGFALNPQARRHTSPNRVRLLRTDRSLPVAPHPASRRRSYLQLLSFGILRCGLSPH